MSTPLRSILAIPCNCQWTSCGWEGLTGDCDADGDGDLICPDCNRPVAIDYNEHELNPKAQP